MPFGLAVVAAEAIIMKHKVGLACIYCERSRKVCVSLSRSIECEELSTTALLLRERKKSVLNVYAKYPQIVTPQTTTDCPVLHDLFTTLTMSLLTAARLMVVKTVEQT